MKWLLLVLLALVACTPSGGGTAPSTVTVDVGVPEYVRSHWGRWNDPDGNCQDTRQEVLVAEGTDLVFTDDGCRVISGTWNCPFTGQVFHDPRKLDIDHMVPLKAAHTAGGWEWERERKKAYYNDQSYEHHLVAVSLSANRSKGSKTPMEWMPPNKAFHCDYLRAWVTVKKNWRLETECPFLLSMLVEACGEKEK